MPFSSLAFAQDTTLNITSTPAISLITSSNNITMNVEPTSTGSFQTTPLIITAGTNNPNGYTLYFSVVDNNTNLAGNNGNISTLDNDNNGAGYTPDSFTMNRWGYSIGNIADPTNDTTIYHPAPTIASPTIIDTYNNSINMRNTTINLATKVDFATAAGSYSKQLVVSMLPTISTYELIYNPNTTDIVANLPSPIIAEHQWSDAPTPFIIDTTSIPTRAGYDFKGYTTTNGSTTAEYTYNATTSAFTPSTLTPSTTSSTLYAVWEEVKVYIQDFTLSMCQTQASAGNLKVYDKRDENDYTVRYINNQCWMTQNLRFTGTSVPAATSNVTANKTLTYYQLDTNGKSGGKCYDSTGYSNACIKDSGSTTTGVWYNYYAATAGTVSGSSNSTAATQDICPKGWHLPSGPNTTSGTDFNKLVGNTTAGYQDTPTSLTAFGAVAGGNYYNGSLSSTGRGLWWSATAFNTTGRYSLLYYGSESGGNSYGNRHLGVFVRCVRSS